MHTPLRWFGAVSRAGAIVAGWALMAISVATCIEIVGRKYFGFSFRGLDELSGYLLGGVSAFGFAYTLSRNAHMRVTLLFPYVSPSVQAALNVVAMVTLAAMAAFCAWRGGFEVLEGLTTGKRSNTPLAVQVWIPLAVWFAGMVLFAFGTVLMALHSLALLVRDRPRLNRTYGPQSLEQEITSEIAHVAAGERAEARRP